MSAVSCMSDVFMYVHLNTPTPVEDIYPAHCTIHYHFAYGPATLPQTHTPHHTLSIVLNDVLPSPCPQWYDWNH